MIYLFLLIPFILAEGGELFIRFDGAQSATDIVVGYIFHIIFTIGLALTALYFVWSYYYYVLRIKILCQNRELSKKEVDFFYFSTKSLKVENATILLEKRNHFDNFSTSIALAFDSLNVQKIHDDSVMLYSIRTRLHFRHGFYESKIKSSRCLPVNHSLEVFYYDEGKHLYHTFTSMVVERNELFLIIRAPCLELNMLILGNSHPTIEISLKHGDDLEYRFESQFAFYLPSPDNLWYVLHSRIVQCIERIQDLQLPGIILYSASEEIDEVEEFKITIRQLDYKGAIIRLEGKQNCKMDHGGFLVLNFSLKGQDISCQGSIQSIDMFDGLPHYILQFKESNTTTIQQLITFTINPQFFLAPPEEAKTAPPEKALSEGSPAN